MDELENDPDEEEGDPSAMPLTVNSQMYAMADKFGVPRLKAYSLAKIKNVFEMYFSYKDFVRGISIAWSSTISSDKGLRDVFLKEYLLRRPSLLEHYSHIAESLKATEDFLWDAMLEDWRISAGVSTLGLSKNSTCKKCGAAKGIDPSELIIQDS